MHYCKGFSGGSEGKESACNAGEPGLIPRFDISFLVLFLSSLHFEFWLF